MSPDVLISENETRDAELFQLTWDDLGACLKPHSHDLTMRIDTCDDWIELEQEQAS